MKKYIVLILIALSVFNVKNTYGQEDDRRERYERRDEYLSARGGGRDVPSCYCGEKRDFNFSYGINNVINNYFLAQSAQRRSYGRWLNRQNQLIKRYLENKYYTKFKNFDAARNELISRVQNRRDGGLDPSTQLYPQFQNRIDSKRNAAQRGRRNSIKNLKLLKLRESEIKNRKIYSSLYPNKVVNGKPLLQYRSINDVRKAFASEYTKVRNFDVDYNRYKSLESSPIYKSSYTFSEEFLKQKVAFYNKFNGWNRLNLMAYLIGINNGSIKVGMMYKLPKQFEIFRAYHNNNFDKIEASTRRTSKTIHSVLDKNYWHILYKKYSKYSFNLPHYQEMNITRALKEHEKLMKKKLEELMKNTSINSYASVDYIVSNLSIRDNNQLEWLNAITEQKAKNIQSILWMAQAKWGSNLDLSNFYRRAKATEIANIRKGGRVMAMAKEIGLNSTYKKWLANNLSEAGKLLDIVNRNKLQDTKRFILRALKLITNKRINSVNELIRKEDRICISSLKFYDVGTNWQAAGIKNVNIQFLTIGKPTRIVNVFINRLYLGFPKRSPAVGGYLTNNNARYLAEQIITNAEKVTDFYQSQHPHSNSIQLRDYFYKKLVQLAKRKGGRVSTTAPLGWSGTLQEHQTYFLNSGWECD